MDVGSGPGGRGAIVAGTRAIQISARNAKKPERAFDIGRFWPLERTGGPFPRPRGRLGWPPPAAGPGCQVPERETGFEPATSTLARLRSTAELFPHGLRAVDYAGCSCRVSRALRLHGHGAFTGTAPSLARRPGSAEARRLLPEVPRAVNARGAVFVPRGRISAMGRFVAVLPLLARHVDAGRRRAARLHGDTSRFRHRALHEGQGVAAGRQRDDDGREAEVLALD